MAIEFEEGDIVLCTVDKIVRTNVFVHLGRDDEGTIILSEIAPGRIRNLRNYVVPKKKIVCKILRIKKGNIELSLRRVSKKEKKEKLDEVKQEKSYSSIIKSVVKNKTEETIAKIEKEDTLLNFFVEAKENPKKLEKFFTKSDSEKILSILNTQKQKIALVKKEISLSTKKPDGLNLIKKILGALKDVKVKYISAGKYALETESDDLKKADQKLRGIIFDIETQSKKQGLEFSIKEK